MSRELHELMLLRGFFDPGVVDLAAGLVTADHFTDEGRKLLAGVLLRMVADGEYISRDTVATHLEVQGDTHDGARARVDAVLAEDCPDGKHYATIVKHIGMLSEKDKRRKLAERLLGEEGQQASAAVVQSWLNDHSLVATALEPSTTETFLDGVRRVMNSPPKPYYTLGFGPLDERYRIYPHSFNVILADSGQGKTSMMLNAAFNLAKQGHNAYIISIEMDADSVHSRIAGMACNIPAWRFDEGVLTEAEKRHVNSVIADNIDVFSRIYVEAPSGLTGEAVHPMLVRLVGKYGPGVVFIDYLQTMTASGRHINTSTEMEKQVSSSITRACKTTGVPVIALSQVTTGLMGMDKIKGSKQAKHDGWTILSLEWQDEDGTAGDAKEVVLIARLIKGRKKGVIKGGVPLVYNLETQRIFYSDEVRIKKH